MARIAPISQAQADAIWAWADQALQAADTRAYNLARWATQRESIVAAALQAAGAQRCIGGWYDTEAGGEWYRVTSPTGGIAHLWLSSNGGLHVIGIGEIQG